MNGDENKILDRSKYSRKTIETYEIIAAYFVDIYYNHLYLEAKKLRTNKSVNSVTEGYKHSLTAFLQSIEKPELYKKSLVSMHQFFIDSGFSGLTFGNCIDRVIREFIPNDYYESVTPKQKTSILRLVLNQTNKLFIDKIARKYIYMIIDKHNEVDNIRLLQDDFIDLLFLEREGMYHRFVSTKTKTNRHVSVVIMESMQDELKKLYVEKFNIKKLNTELKKIIIAKDVEHKELQNKLEVMANTIAELQNELNSSRLCEDTPGGLVEVQEPAEMAPVVIIDDEKKDADGGFAFDETSDIW